MIKFNYILTNSKFQLKIQIMANVIISHVLAFAPLCTHPEMSNPSLVSIVSNHLNYPIADKKGHVRVSRSNLQARNALAVAPHLSF